MGSEELKNDHRATPRAFSRENTKISKGLTFKNIVEMQIRGLERSYQTEIDSFFDSLSEDGIALTTPSDSAFCQARQKIKHSVFIELSDHLVDSHYSNITVKDWNGLRAIAIDGSTVHLPDTLENIEHFGAWHPNGKDVPCPKARVSFAYDPLNKMIVDAMIGPKNIGEDPMAVEHLQKLQYGDICLYDRGYLSFLLMMHHQVKDIKYCMRVPIDQCTVLCEDLQEGEDDITVYYHASHNAKESCLEAGLPCDSLQVRLLKIRLNTGEYEVLATNVFNENLSLTDFKDLYNLRWAVEEEYKRMKSRVELEAYSGKLCEFVYQDFYADIIRLNLSSILATKSRCDLEMAGVKNKHSHAPNMSYVLSKTREVVTTIIHKSLEYLIILMSIYNHRIKRNSEPIRPGRSFPRSRKPFRAGRFLEYKHARC